MPAQRARPTSTTGRRPAARKVPWTRPAARRARIAVRRAAISPSTAAGRASSRARSTNSAAPSVRGSSGQRLPRIGGLPGQLEEGRYGFDVVGTGQGQRAPAVPGGQQARGAACRDSPGGYKPEHCRPAGEDLVGIDGQHAVEVGGLTGDVAGCPPRSGKHGIGDGQRAHQHILHGTTWIRSRQPNPSRVRWPHQSGDRTAPDTRYAIGRCVGSR